MELSKSGVAFILFTCILTAIQIRTTAAWTMWLNYGGVCGDTEFYDQATSSLTLNLTTPITYFGDTISSVNMWKDGNITFNSGNQYNMAAAYGYTDNTTSTYIFARNLSVTDLVNVSSHIQIGSHNFTAMNGFVVTYSVNSSSSTSINTYQIIVVTDKFLTFLLINYLNYEITASSSFITGYNNTQVNISISGSMSYTFQVNLPMPLQTNNTVSYFLNFGSSASDSVLPSIIGSNSLSNLTQCYSSLNLGFTMSISGTSFNSLSVCSGYLYLDGSSSNYIAGAAGLSFNTYMSGTVYYRSITDNSTLNYLSGWINMANMSSGVSFNATNAFLITWSNVNVNSYAETSASFQIILLTNNVNSFYMQIFGSISNYNGSYYCENGNNHNYNSNTYSNMDMEGVYTFPLSKHGL